MAQMAVIASHFPFWQRILSEADCGVCLDPLALEEIDVATQPYFRIQIKRARPAGVAAKWLSVMMMGQARRPN